MWGKEEEPLFLLSPPSRGLWATPIISSSQAVASAQPMLRCQSQGYPSVHSHLASVCSRLAALREDPLRMVEQHRGRRCSVGALGLTDWTLQSAGSLHPTPGAAWPRESPAHSDLSVSLLKIAGLFANICQVLVS